MKKSSPGHPAIHPEKFVPVAITGIGCIFPRSVGAKEYWRTLFRGVDCITEVPETHWSPSDYYDSDPQKPDHVYCKRGGFLDPVGYDPSEFGIPPTVLEATDSSQLLGLVAAKMALNDAGYGEGGKEFNRARTSVILGATGTQELTIPLATRLGHPVWRKALNDSGLPAEKTEEVIKRISAGFVSWQESSFPGLLGNVIAGRIANRLDLGGTNCVVDAACGSSLGAVHLALLELISGRSDMAITGGVDLLNDIFMHMCFAKTGVLSKSGDAKPFSEDADGTVLGEGLGMVTLKRLEDAEHDGDRIYAVIRGAGSSSDGKSQSIYAPSAKGQEKALKKAYETAGFSPVTVDLLEAHGTGTIVGDEVEFSALRHVFGKREGANQIALGSVKSMIGHTKAAAGAAGMIKTALALYNKVIPPTLKISKPDPKLRIEESPIFLPSVSFPWFSNGSNPRRAGVSAFGFGGSNFHLAMEEYIKDKKEPSWDGSVEIFAFSGDSRDEVKAELEKAVTAISADSRMTNMTAWESRKNFDIRKKCRLLVSSLFDSVSDVLEKTKAMLDSGEKEHSSRSGSAYYSETAVKGKTAFIFPGQGSQYTGMSRELSCIFPEMMESIEHASSAFNGDRKLHDFMYPRAGEDEENEAELRNTSVAQPAIGAVSIGMMKILERFGIRADSVCGHSFGELSALACSGTISEDDFFRLAALRGKYMAEAGKGGDAGTMLAVKAKLSDIEKMISETGVDVVLANRNSHDQGVLSGSAEAIEQAKQFCKERKMRGTQLNVAAAFHSRFVASAAVPFSGELEKVEFRKSDIPVYANTTASAYPSSADESKHLLGNQLVNSVNFVGIIEAMHDSGVHTFIETGPKTVLTGLVKSILKGREFECLATDDSSGKKSGLLDIASLLCRLGAMGHDVRLSNWETQPSVPRKPKMNIPITGTNYRNPQKIIKIPVSKPVEIVSSDSKNTESNVVRKSAALKTAETASRTEIRVPESGSHLTTAENSTENRFEKLVQKPEISDARIHDVSCSGNSGSIHAKTCSSDISDKNSSSCDNQPGYNNAARAADMSVNSDLSGKHGTSTIQAGAADAAVRSITEGFRAMQTLQMQTTDAHKKFLDTQMQAGKTLETLMCRIGEISGMSAGVQSGYAANPAKSVSVYATSGSAPVYQHTQQANEKSSDRSDAPMNFKGVSPTHSGVSLSTSSSSSVQHTVKTAAPAAIENRTSEMPEAAEASIKTVDSGKMKATLLAVVSELTGYPVEMLDLDMDIESDLGIDSIKRVEILSSFEERMPGTGNVDPSDLGRLKTLGQIIEYISERSGGVSSSQSASVSPSASSLAPSVAAASAAAVKSSGIDAGAVKNVLIEVVSSLTGYPAEMLDLDMDIESDLGIDSIKRVEILSAFEEKMPGAGNVDPSDLGRLKTLGHIISYIVERNPASVSGSSSGSSAMTGVSSSSHDAGFIRDTLIEVVSSLTGYPAEMLDLDMDIESDLGIDSIKRVEILSAFEEKIPGAATIDPSDLGRLKTLGQIINHITASSSSEAAGASLHPAGSGSSYMPSGMSSSRPSSGSNIGSFNPEDIKNVLIEVVSSLTGYPSEMLDPDMDIESDLGIDSIKRVEILSAFEERMPGIPQVQPDELGRLKTLGQIISHITGLVSLISVVSSASSIVDVSGKHDVLQQSSDIQKTGQVKPSDSLSAVTPESISRKVVRVFRDAAGPSPSEKLKIAGKVYIAGHVAGIGEALASELKSRGVDAETVELESISNSGASITDNLSGLVIIAGNDEKVIWHEDKTEFIKKAFLAARNTSTSLCEAGKKQGAFFATVTRLDGAFGFLSSHVSDPMYGALAGLAKTARIEWPDVSCRAFDISPFITDLKKTVSSLADEILLKGAAETGFDDNSRYGLELAETSFKKPLNVFDRNDVVVITGGAKGVTAACAEELASFCQPVMILLGRSPEPEKEPSWLSGIKDEPAMKKAILENEFKGKKISPQELEKSFRKYKGAREISDTIETIKKTGSKAAYFQADVRNHADMESVMDKVRTKFGSVTGIIHGAGVLEDRFIADKTSEQFDNVFGTKIDGLKNLLDTTRNDPLKAIVFFSSVSARMGNRGQVDYAMANEVLNKMAVYEAAKRPACRVVSINWGPWDGGMVSPSLKKEFNRQGIELIPLKSGAAAMVSEMCSGTESSVEVVIGAEFRHEEKTVSGKNISSASVSASSAVSDENPGIKITAGINEYPVLKDHMIGGKAVVPVAVMAEWFGHAALISNAGLHFHGLENLRVLNGIKLGSESMEFRVTSSKPVKSDGVFRTDFEIRSRTHTGSERIHARATAVLGSSGNKNAVKNTVTQVISEDGVAVTADIIYDEILFHGKKLMGISEIRGLSDRGMTAYAVTAPLPSEWIKVPLRKKWVADPLLLDSAFQMASAWCYMNFGKVSLPSFVGQYIQYSERIPEGRTEISMNTRNVSGSRMSADFVFRSEKGDVIAEILNFESVMDFSLNSAFKNGGIKLTVTAPADLN